VIDDPKALTRPQVEQRLGRLQLDLYLNQFCGEVVCKAPFAEQLVTDWHNSPNALHKAAAYRTLMGLAKNHKKLPDAYFEPFIARIEAELQTQENWVRDAMNNCLLAIGKRSLALRPQALLAAQRIGKVHVDYGDNSCEALNVVKHLSR
jgi:3-methyladenine DNA glycosylase AlkD